MDLYRRWTLPILPSVASSETACRNMLGGMRARETAVIVSRMRKGRSRWDRPPRDSWARNQLRHNAATRIRAAYGIEAARIILGHSSAVTSEIYAEVDKEKAREIMGIIG